MDEQSASAPDNHRDLLGLASLLFDHIEGQISRADTKAELTITADGIIAAAMTSLLIPARPAVIPALFGAEAALAVRVATAGTVLAFIALLISITCALVVVRPSLRHPGPPQLLYFGHIARLRNQEFVDQFMKQSNRELTTELLSDIHTKARIAKRKYAGVGLSVSFLMVGLGLAIGANVALAFQ